MSELVATDDPLLSEFTTLRQAVIEQMRAVARLEQTLAQVHSTVRQAGADGFKESVAVIRQEVDELAQAVRRQETALRSLPNAAAIGTAVKNGVAGLAQDYAKTQSLVVDTAQIVQEAAKEGREAAAKAARQAVHIREAWINDRVTMVLSLVVMVLGSVSGFGLGYGVRGWWSPPPAEVFARYVAAGNDPNWLLCQGENAKKFTAGKNWPACELKFWLENPGP